MISLLGPTLGPPTEGVLRPAASPKPAAELFLGGLP